ncbi:MAG: alkane 1-monooxygenase, partial [Myxococcales bacterium]|nr:alkane 1-monooxygenase [Myxococcales bacterium]
HWLAPLFFLPMVGSVLIDRRSPPEPRQPSPRMPAWPFDLLLLVLVLLQLTNITLLARMMGSQSLLSMDTLAGIVVVGSSSGYSAIVVAHELIHRPSKALQQVGRLLLTTVMYEHFYTEHVRGHHVRVGTPQDPATARFGETFVRFYVRTVPAQLRSAWRLETTRLGDPEMRWHDPRILRSRVVHGLIVEWGLAFAILGTCGLAAFVVFLGQALWASRALEVVNYFEHWGLTRSGKRVEPMHSWDTDSAFTYYALTGLSRHADHHAFASRPYQQLRLWEQSPKLPRGYLAMFWLVLGRNQRFQKLMTAELKRRGLGPFATEQPETA